MFLIPPGTTFTCGQHSPRRAWLTLVSPQATLACVQLKTNQPSSRTGTGTHLFFPGVPKDCRDTSLSSALSSVDRLPPGHAINVSYLPELPVGTVKSCLSFSATESADVASLVYNFLCSWLIHRILCVLAPLRTILGSSILQPPPSSSFL